MLHNLISRTRRNHGLEHATLNLLQEHYPHQSFAGHSDPGGFWIIGDIDAPRLTEITTQALKKLQAGNQNLALHKNCGTNMLTTGTMAGLAGAAGLIGTGNKKGSWWERLPLVILLATVAVIFSHPLGLYLQRNVTTSGNPGSLHITNVTTHQQGRVTAHRIQTQG